MPSIRAKEKDLPKIVDHTLGILLEAKRKGFLHEVKRVLDDLIAKAGFWVSRELYARILQAAEE